MADKIVQLKDKNSNNLYPISGSSLAESVSTGAIVDGAVTTAKIATGAVTSDEIDWTTLGDQNSYLKLGSVLIQWGTMQAGSHTENTTVNLPTAFANNTYTLSLTNQFPEAGSSLWWAFCTGKTTTNFTYWAGRTSITATGGGSNTNNIVNWVAIGLAP